jgi:hypothetical protein
VVLTTTVITSALDATTNRNLRKSPSAARSVVLTARRMALDHETDFLRFKPL